MMDTYLCPKGHQSTEPDYCSECGAKMQAAASSTPAPATPAAGAEHCPDCGTPRDPDIAFCEICGYNFVTGAHGDLSAVPAPPACGTASRAGTRTCRAAACTCVRLDGNAGSGPGAAGAGQPRAAGRPWPVSPFR